MSFTESLPNAVEKLIAAVNAQDTEGFVGAFTPDAVIDDWGHQVVGHDEIRAWNEREFTGPHARMVIRVTMSSSISNARCAELLDVPLDVSTVSTIVWPARSTRVTSIRTSGPVNSPSFQARISS